MSDDQQPNLPETPDEKRASTAAYLPIGLSLGISIGIVFGLLIFDNLALGMSLGIAIGAGLGVALGAGARNQPGRGQPEHDADAT